MPCLQKPFAVLDYQSPYFANLVSAEALVVCEFDGVQPELRLCIIAIHGNVRGLSALVREEVKTVRAD